MWLFIGQESGLPQLLDHVVDLLASLGDRALLLKLSQGDRRGACGPLERSSSRPKRRSQLLGEQLHTSLSRRESLDLIGGPLIAPGHCAHLRLEAVGQRRVRVHAVGALGELAVLR
ncbi:MAG TPA: hypothetical protein VJM75_12515, partial [Acidimicrobiales bacterium]|nr:hypothetical protein [Acidimicrobiales bacterium]